MNRPRGLFTLAAVAVAATGCSNAPIAGTMDCLFPSRPHSRGGDVGPRPSDDPFRPRADDPLPPPKFEDGTRGGVSRPRNADATADTLPPPRGADAVPRTYTTDQPRPTDPRPTDTRDAPLPAPGFGPAVDPFGTGR